MDVKIKKSISFKQREFVPLFLNDFTISLFEEEHVCAQKATVWLHVARAILKM